MTETGNAQVIGIDLMGGDFAPTACIDGCILALERGLSVKAYGSHEAISALLSKARSVSDAQKGSLETEVCGDTIGPDESPVTAIRQKEDSSIRKGILAVKSGETGAFVSAGSTGALVAGGVLILGRAPGIDKPCLATVMPSESGRGVLVLDLGASADARPETLVQFAVMGSAYAKEVLGWEEPKVSLLNIGTEPEKGSIAARKAYSLLEKAPVRFAGNIEARHVFSGESDVVVTDGFTGNIFLKSCEGTAMFQNQLILKEVTSSAITKIAGSVLRPAFHRVKALMDYSAYGGAPLLGLNGCIVKCHGPSRPDGIVNGMLQAKLFVEKGVSAVIAGILRGPAEGEAQREN